MFVKILLSFKAMQLYALRAQVELLAKGQAFKAFWQWQALHVLLQLVCNSTVYT